jgi:UDP-N-acetylmuramate-alanine ligase
LVAQIPHTHVVASGDVAHSVHWLVAQLQPGDVLITLSAGDGTMVGSGVLHALESRHG